MLKQLIYSSNNQLNVSHNSFMNKSVVMSGSCMRAKGLWRRSKDVTCQLRVWPLITQEYGSIVLPVANYSPDGLVHSSESLLFVPLLARKVLRAHTHTNKITLSHRNSINICDCQITFSSHLQFRSILPNHLIQELHLQDDSRVHPGRERKSGDDDTSTKGVCKIQTLASLTQ